MLSAMAQQQRPDFIDRFYSDVGKIAAVTDRLTRLAKEGVELAEAGKTSKAKAIHARCLVLDARRLKLKTSWKSYLKSAGIGA